jgi:tRNA threonylcarbamoyl adenosine modification protein (Sua5/YciO/YrdC/YwlC family)
MAQIYSVHPQSPQQRVVDQIRDRLKDGAVMLYPTDTVYAIGCDLYAKNAIERVRQLKQLSNDKPLTFLCSSLSNITQYAYVNDGAYRLMRRLIPGPYTFLLPATKLVPRLVQNPKRKTTGIRVPDHPVCQSLLETLGNPVISTSAHLPTDPDAPVRRHQDPLTPAELFDRFDKLVDVIVDSGQEVLTDQVSSILDLSADQPALIRKGLGWDSLPADLINQLQVWRVGEPDKAHVVHSWDTKRFPRPR